MCSHLFAEPVYNAINHHFHFDCSAVQIFGYIDEKQLVRDASWYAIYFVVLAVAVGVVQFIGVSLCFTGNSHHHSRLYVVLALLALLCSLYNYLKHTYPGCIFKTPQD